MNLPFFRVIVVALTAIALLTGYPAHAQNEAPRPVTETEAEMALEQGRNLPAINIYTRLIRQSPKRFKLYLGRGIAFYKAGRYDKAVLDFGVFIKLRPGLAEGYLNRAFAYKEMGKYREALVDLDNVDAITPNSRAAQQLREQILAAMPTP